MEATTQVRSAWLMINSVVSAPRVSYRDTVKRPCDMQARSVPQLDILSAFAVGNKYITRDLPFRSVIAEEADTILSTSNANTFMKDS